MPESITIFAGPSLHGTELQAGPSGLCWVSPARRGDIAQLVESQAPGAIGLADGTFHSYSSVGHVEIRTAIERGWRVYGG